MISGKAIVVTLIVCSYISSAQAQINVPKHEIGFSAGMFIYQGDLTPSALGSYKTLRPAINLFPAFLDRYTPPFLSGAAQSKRDSLADLHFTEADQPGDFGQQPTFSNLLVHGWLGIIEKLGPDFQARGSGIQAVFFRQRRTLVQDDVLLDSGLGVGVPDIGSKISESVGVNDLIIADQYAYGVLQLGNENTAVGFIVVVRQSQDAASQALVVTSQQVEGTNCVDVRREERLVMTFQCGSVRIGNLNVLAGRKPLATILVVLARFKLHVRVCVERDPAQGVGFSAYSLPPKVVPAFFH